MADDIRLYMFQSGILKCLVQNIKIGQGLGEPYEIPVPWYLITHPKGNVVIDGGNAAECVDDPKGHWEGIDRGLLPRDDRRAGVRAGAARRPDSTRPTCGTSCSRTCISTTRARSPRSTSSPTRRCSPRARSTSTRRSPTGSPPAATSRPTTTSPASPGSPRGARRRLRPLRRRHGAHVADARPRAGPPVLRDHAAGLRRDAADRRRGLHDRPLEGEGAARLPRLGGRHGPVGQKLHRIAERSGSTVVTGHDPDAWPNFKQAPEYYD